MQMVSGTRSIAVGMQTMLRFTLLLALFTLLDVDRAQAKSTFQHASPMSTANQAIITVTGKNDPAQDLSALAAAISQASVGDTVVLEGVFDFSNCKSGITLT